jgi:hypothetical protein
VVEERNVPRYWRRNPGTAGVRAGLPVVPSIDDLPEYQPVPNLPPDTKVVEEEYFEE